MAEISDIHVKQFTDNLLSQFQQGASVLRGSIRERSCTGKVDFHDRIGPTTATRVTTRHGDTPLVPTNYSRRSVTLVDYDVADLIDRNDRIRMLTDPQSSLTRNFVSAMGRAFDYEVITAMYSTAYSGEEGSTAVAFADDWPITRTTAQGDDDVSGAALTVGNLLTFKKALDNNDVPPSGRHILLPPAGITQLLGATSAPLISSSDYNTVKALVAGEIDTFLGFKFHTIAAKYLPLAASTDYYAFYWHEDAMAVSIGQDVTIRVSERNDKRHALQVYACMSFGAGRIQGEGVGRLRLDVSL